MAEEFLYSDKDLKKLSEDGHNLYKMAEQDLNSENWYKAGDKYDSSYTGAWGDALFAGIEFGTDQFAFSGLSIPIPYLSQEEKKNIFEDSLSESKCRLVVSCEFYLKAIEIDPNHFYANLQLASALTAALQVTPACAYWKKSIQLNKSVALAALTADSMAKFHRGTATRLVITALEGDQSKMQDAITQLQFNSSFFEQMELAKVLLESSPYIKSRIEKDKGVKGSERLKAEELYNEGNANAGLGEFEIALSMYEKAISFDRSNPMYFNNRAATLKRLERFKEAIDQYEEITREFPQYGKAFLSIGSTNIEIGEYQAAVSAYRKFDSAFRSGKFEFSPIVGGLDQTIQGGDLLQTVILTSINYLSPNHQELAIQAFQEAINEISAPLPLKPRVLSPSVSKTVYEPNKFSEINVEVQSTNDKTFDKRIFLSRKNLLIIATTVAGLCMWLFWISPQLKERTARAELNDLINQKRALAEELDATESAKAETIEQLKELETQLISINTSLNKPDILSREKSSLKTSRENAVSLLMQKNDRPLAQAVSWCTVNYGSYPCSTNLGCPPTVCSSESRLPEGFPVVEYNWEEPLVDYELEFLAICKQGFNKAGYAHCTSYRSKVEIDLIPQRVIEIDNEIQAAKEEAPILQQEKKRIVTKIEQDEDRVTALSQEMQSISEDYKDIRLRIINVWRSL